MSDPVRPANLLRQTLYYGQLGLWVIVCTLALTGRMDFSGLWWAAGGMLVLIGLEALVNRHYGQMVRKHQGEPQEDPTCQACGYKLVGLESTRCPECGRAFLPNDRPITTRAEHLSWAALVRTMTLGILVSTGLFAVAVIRAPAGELSDFLTQIFTDPLSLARFDRPIPAWWAMLWAAIAGYGLVILVTYLVGRQRMKGYRAPIPTAFPCPGCGKTLPHPLTDACPACGRAVQAEDLFSRCKPWNLNDRRFRRFHRLITAGSVVLNLLIFGMLVGLLVFRQHLANLHIGTNAALLWLVAVLLMLVGLVLLRQRAARVWGRKIWLIFTQAVPSCPHCDHDLTGLPLRGRCPQCKRKYDPTDLHG